MNSCSQSADGEECCLLDKQKLQVAVMDIDIVKLSELSVTHTSHHSLILSSEQHTFILQETCHPIWQQLLGYNTLVSTTLVPRIHFGRKWCIAMTD